MSKKEKYILMYKDYEVLSFSIELGKINKLDVTEKLERFDLAPYGMNNDTPQEELNRVLFRFFNSRTIPPTRWDYEDILKATNCKNSLELSFKSHGLSLSNHYWFKKKDEKLKYDDINFFTNKWDDSFARAVLSRNYDALKNADLNVPDIVTPGWGVKGWLCEEEPTLYKLGIHKDHPDECLAEVLASNLARRMFKEGEVLHYELKTIYGQYASVSKVMIAIDEEIVQLSRILPPELYALYRTIHNEKKNMKVFFDRLKESGFPDLYEFFVKIMCLRTLSFVSDLHFDNLSMIRNLRTGELRAAPIFDLGGAFGSSKTGHDFLSKLSTGSYIIIYFLFGDIDPSWDFSWYDPTRLVGFEDEIRETLSKSEFYDETLINNIIEVYKRQKASLDEAKEKQNNK